MSIDFKSLRGVVDLQFNQKLYSWPDLKLYRFTKTNHPQLSSIPKVPVFTNQCGYKLSVVWVLLVENIPFPSSSVTKPVTPV